MPSAFTVTVSQSDWDDGLGGWRCPALAIPGAKIEAVYDRGRKADDSWYEVLADHRMLRWAREERPERLTISIALTEELSTQAETSRWKKLAIVFPAVATVISALITSAIPKLLGAPAPSNASATPVMQASTNSQKSVPMVAAKIEEVRIAFPRGDKVIVAWKDMPKDAPGDDALRKAGVDLDEVNAGTRLAYAALAKRDAESIRYGPLIFGNKFADGLSNSVMNSGPSPDAGYTEFQMFQGPTEVTILLHPMNEKPPPLAPSKSGINWENVKIGLRRALTAMYQGKKSVEFETVGIYSESDGSWEYRIPFRIKDR